MKAVSARATESLNLGAKLIAADNSGAKICKIVSVKKAKAKNIRISGQHVRTGRFAEVCFKIAKKTEPHKIITTRSKRPAWVKRFFGSAVDALIQKVNCEVIEA